jgi:hypothetical protein
MWEGFETNFPSLSRSLDFCLPKSPPHRILKGGNYGSEEKSQKESQKEKEVTQVLRCGVAAVN